MAIDPKVMEKIKKLLALAGEGGLTNDNAEEADSAFKMAAKLCEKHGLAIADVDLSTGEVSNIDNMQIRQGGANVRSWANTLAAILARVFDCKVVLLGTEHQVFVGTKSDLEMAIWYYKFLKIRIARQAQHKFRLVKDQKTYGMGCCHTLNERLTAMFVKSREEVRNAETTALVVVKKEEVSKEFKRMFPKLRTKKSARPTGSRRAYEEGMKDGRTMQLNKSIGGGVGAGHLN